ncbi:MAG TPA: PQQ-binding-like beta-propeller repeat protein, partial [Cryomorphaceae bacterium]|nr:PQQ-binding-like beta-propeller repeat protein [Cryomorphaceae bacterium]
DGIIPVWESKKIFLLDLKFGKEQVAVVDMVTGNLLWDSDRYKLKKHEMISYVEEENGFLFTFKDVNVFVNADTGEELWSTAKFKGKIGEYIYENGFLTTVNFVPSGLGALFTGFKNQIAKINMKTGEIVWENTYIGRAEKKIITGEWLYSLELMNDNVVLMLNGLQVYDYKTGAQKWSAAFDYEVPVKAPANATSFGVYGALPAPIFTDEFVYVLDMSGKRQQFINKYQRSTGKLVWKSQEIKGGARVVPNMYLENDKIILQIGGIVEIQGIFKNRDADGNITYTRKVYDDNIKPYGVQAFSDEDGRLIWDSEKFKKGITNMLVYGENLVVCSGKELYNLKIQDGSENYVVDVKNGGVGKAVRILPYEDNIVVVGEKGVSTFKAEDGSLIAANKYKRASVVDFHENILILETDKNDIAAFDVADKCKFWAYNAKKGSGNSLTTDGKHVYVYEKKTVSRLFTTAQK